MAEVMTRMLERARAEWERRERGEVAAEIASLLAASGLSGEGFARRIGTSGSRLSTYLSGKVVPSATLLVRMRHVAGACPPLKAAAGYPAPSVPDPERAARQLAAVLGLVDSLPFRVKRRPLTYPVLARL
ncbi:MAG TPA: helix-turn-helix transcriptional regulator [Acidimicrobiales bacterium]|nr:helix-turn-helix transcriptional regulator [Acidimicrobiales bacterium]